MNLKRFLKTKIKNNKFLNKLYRKYIFRSHYLTNHWGDNDSISGTGSNLIQTNTIRIEIPKTIKKYKIKSILDIPCGDYYWMKEIDFKGIKYLGADIVPDLIKKILKNLQKIM